MFPVLIERNLAYVGVSVYLHFTERFLFGVYQLTLIPDTHGS